jgi:hypothetical protein
LKQKYIKTARDRDSNAELLWALPIYKDGRGIVSDAASTRLSAREVVEMMGRMSSGSTGPLLDTSHMSADDLDSFYHADLGQMTFCGAFLFGYPHLP